MATAVRTRRPSEARDRLLSTASALFYAKGVHAVGVDELIAEAGITRATFYRHFPSKDDLIVAYLTSADQMIRVQTDALVDKAESGVDAVRAIAISITHQIRSDRFRGCAFLNAAAEYPDEADPVHQAVLAHRAWFLATVTEQLTRALEAPADDAAKFFVMLRDGAMASGCLTDPDSVCQVFLRGIDGILDGRAAPA